MRDPRFADTFGKDPERTRLTAMWTRLLAMDRQVQESGTKVGFSQVE